MPQLGDIAAWIEVDGVKLDEYQTEAYPDSVPSKVSCWVISEEGKEFVVHWECHDETICSCAVLKLDGQRVMRKRGRGHNRIDNVHLDANRKCGRVRMKFGKVLLTDDDNADLLDDASAAALGVIHVEIQRGKLMPRRSLVTAAKKKHPDVMVPDVKPVHEKMKKAGCHRVIHGTILSLDKGPRVNPTTFVPDDSEKRTFVFRYRPRELLQAMDIKPTETGDLPGKSEGTAGEESSEVKDEVEDDEDDEADQRQLQSLQNQLAEVTHRIHKRKSDTKEGQSAKRLKREEIPSGVFFQPGEVIDLT